MAGTTHLNQTLSKNLGSVLGLLGLVLLFYPFSMKHLLIRQLGSLSAYRLSPWGQFYIVTFFIVDFPRNKEQRSVV